MGNGAGAISGPASVLPDVGVVHAGNHQHAHSLPEHVGGDAGARVELLPVQTPSDRDRHVPVGDHTDQLGKRARVDHIGAEGEWNNSWWF